MKSLMQSKYLSGQFKGKLKNIKRAKRVSLATRYLLLATIYFGNK